MGTDNNTVSFSDLFDPKTLQGLSERLTPVNVLITLLVAFAIGFFIFFVYKRTFSGVMYSRNFNLSLIVMTMVTTLVMMPITSNLMLSLGMVGALSIVRFRTAVKDAMDTVFIFWAIAVGICLGASFEFMPLAIIGSLAIGLLLFAMSVLKTRSSMPYLLVLHFHRDANSTVRGMLAKLPSHKLKSRTATGDSIELTVEIRLRPEEAGIVDKFMNVDGMYDASVISYQGDLIS